MSKGNPCISMRLTAQQIAHLKEIAAKEGINLTQLLKNAIQFYLLELEKKNGQHQVSGVDQRHDSG